jgi:hypothetical protein
VAAADAIGDPRSARRVGARAWLWATIGLSAGAFALAIALAPAVAAGGAAGPATALPGRGLGWILLVASSGHVAATGWFYGERDVRAHVASHRWRYVWTPLGLAGAMAVIAAALPPAAAAWLLLPYFGWQFFHFQKQNLGLAALAAIGVGTGVYWYMGGPGVDPHYNGTTTEATSWGATQAAWTLAAMKKIHVTYPVVWADIEFPGIQPATDNGWKSIYTGPCTEVKKSGSVGVSVDRAEFNGFANYITAHSSYKVGVYSAPAIWTSIFGTGTASQIPNTYEWTYEPETASLSAKPNGFRLSGGKGAGAQFFGGQGTSSKYALMWQWSGGGGVRNPYGDYDQIYVSRMK